MLKGIQHFLEFINNNWTSIIIIISLVIAIVEKAKNYFKKSTEEKIAIAKTQISEIIMKLISDAEFDYESYTGAGSIKRSQVIQKIYADYPVLSKVSDQQSVIDFIDETINTSLKNLRKIVTQNQETTTTTTEQENTSVNE